MEEEYKLKCFWDTRLNGIPHEGYSAQIEEQKNDLIEECKKINGTNIMEIGFNLGHSSEIFLKNFPAFSVTSFELGNQFTTTAKFYLDKFYKDANHMLILGDSKKEIIKFSKNFPSAKFDLIFIDGDHRYNTALEDLENCKSISHAETVIIFDDVYDDECDPGRAWKKMINDGKIIETSRKVYNKDRGQVIGKYVL